MVRMIGALLVLMSGAVHAETLYKCTGKSGAVSYQSHPCAADEHTTLKRDYRPEPPLSPQQRRAAYQRQLRGKAESAYLSRLAGTDRRGSVATGAGIATNDASVACQAAKAERQRQLDAVGLKRTFDFLSRLDEMVREACR